MGILEKMFKKRFNNFNEKIAIEKGIIERSKKNNIEENSVSLDDEKNLLKKEELEDNIEEKLYLEHTEIIKNEDYEYPPLEILNYKTEKAKISKKDIEEMVKKLQRIFYSYGISVKVQNVVLGPSIITYQIELASGVTISKIKRLEPDISLNLGSKVISIEQVPNKTLLGIEVERTDKEIVELGEVIRSEEFQKADSKVSIALGKDMNGIIKTINMENISHMLISGTTGSGKSMYIHSIINSILYKANPNEVKLLMIDTKAVELSLYNGIPHLLIPVITDSKRATGALSWAIQEMENRYVIFAQKSVRNIKEYNEAIKEGKEKGLELPNILIIIDEFADLIEFDKSIIEDFIYRLTQRAKKVGIYIIIATERPSIDIITGTIKANIPTRIAFKVFSQADSKTIIDVAGAEKLKGNGDMLYYTLGIPKPIRIQGCYTSEEQIRNIVEFFRKKDVVTYNGNIIENFIK